MKIGYILQTLNTKNGGGRFANNLIEGVKKNGFDVVVAKEINDGFKGEVVIIRGWKMIFNLLKLRKLLKDCDVIHAMDGYPYGIIAWIVNKTLNKKLIISAQGTYSVAPLYRFPTSIFLKQAYKSADKIIAISNFTKKELLKKISLDNIIVVTHGIEDVPNSNEIYESSGRFILGVGGIKERKGYHISLMAFAKIAKQFPDVKYVIVGDPHPAFETVLDNIIVDNDLEGRIEILHHISDNRLVGLYKNAEFFVLTPINTDDHHFEGFGLVYLEAARAGLPVIGTRNTGGEDAIKEGYNGLLVNQHNVDETAEAMETLLSDHKKLEEMSRASYEWVKLNKIKDQVIKFENIYKTLV